MRSRSRVILNGEEWEPATSADFRPSREPTPLADLKKAQAAKEGRSDEEIMAELIASDPDLVTEAAEEAFRRSGSDDPAL